MNTDIETLKIKKESTDAVTDNNLVWVQVAITTGKRLRAQPTDPHFVFTTARNW